jgi:NADPH2:quinone reductase
MKAIIARDFAPLDQLVYGDWPEPEAKGNTVVIEAEAIGVNYPDGLLVQGLYQMKPPLPFVPGSEYAGVIEAVGADVKHVKLGDSVAAFGGTGGFGTHAIVKAALVMPLPKGFAFDDASAFVLTYATTHHALLDRAALKAGETVLVLGAAGGVGTAAIQIAKAVGARVIAAASSDAKCALCTQLGADATINYGGLAPANLRDEIKRLTDGKGPDVVYDPVGGDLAEPVFRSIGWRGRYLVVGFAQGGIPALPWNLALLKGASIVGVFWGDFARREPQANAAALTELATWYAEGKVKPVIDQRLPMTELPKAFAIMGSRQVRGKLVMTNP